MADRLRPFKKLLRPGEEEEDEEDEGGGECLSGLILAIGFACGAFKRQFEVCQQGIPQLLTV